MRSQEELWAEEFSELFPKAKELDAKALAVLRDYYGPAVIEIGRSFQPDEDELELAFKKAFAKTVRESDRSISESSFKQLLFSNMRAGFGAETTFYETQRTRSSANERGDRTGSEKTIEKSAHDSDSRESGGNKSKSFAIICGICLLMGALVLLNYFKSNNASKFEFESDPKNRREFLDEVYEKEWKIESKKERLALFRAAYSLLPNYRIKQSIDSLEAEQFHQKKQIYYDDNDDISYWNESEYDEYGHCTETVYFFDNGKVTDTTTYKYDDKHRLIEIYDQGEVPYVRKYEYDQNRRIETYAEGDLDNLIVCSEDIYDSQGRVIKSIVYPENEEGSTYESEYAYDNNSLVKEFNYYNGIFYEGTEYIKESEFRGTTVIYGDGGKKLGFTTYEKDDLGNNVLGTFYKDETSEGTTVYKAEYDSDGRPLITEYRLRTAGTVDFGSWEKDQNIYDDRGLLIRKEAYLKENGQYQLTYSEEYTYDEEERCVKKVYSNGSYRSTTEYEYNDTGYHLAYHSTYGDGEGYRWEADYIFIPYK